MRILYIIYQICIGLPIFLVLTILTALVTTLGCWLGNGHFWGYYPGKIWSQLTCITFLLPIKVEGKENIDEKTSYVFLANHQGAFDIFLIYGYLGRNFKWMMKKSLRKIPFVGKACEMAGFIFVDKSSPRKVYETIKNAERVLQEVPRWWYSRKGPVPSAATCGSSRKELSRWPTSCSFPSCR